MRRLPLLFSLALVTTVAFVSVASAAVRVRVAVRPEEIPQCHRGQVFVGIANTGDRPIGVHVSFALVGRDSVVAGPFSGRLRLAAGERRHREFPFRVPPMLPPGPYAWVIRAAATDGTHDGARAPFMVVRGECPPRDRVGVDPTIDVERDILESLGLEPAAPTQTLSETWGSIKRRYR